MSDELSQDIAIDRYYTKQGLVTGSREHRNRHTSTFVLTEAILFDLHMHGRSEEEPVHICGDVVWSEELIDTR